MIIKDKDVTTFFEEKGDHEIITHMARVDPVMAAAYEAREWSDNGWTQDRTMRQIAFIPPIVAQRLMKEKPEVMKCGKTMKRWLSSDEGREWLTVKAIDTGRSGHCIVK